jgi:metal-responsive CopG/Arc/MetJ family transcriptional regulator
MSEPDRHREGNDANSQMERVAFRVSTDMAAEIQSFVEFYPSRSALVRDSIRRHICHLKIEGNYPDVNDTDAEHVEHTVIRVPTEMRNHIDQYAAYYETKSALIRDAINSHLTHLQTSTHPENGELPD